MAAMPMSVVPAAAVPCSPLQRLHDSNWSGTQHGRVHALVDRLYDVVPDAAMLRPQQAVIGARKGPIV
jgi:hypothetical protein